MKFVGIDLAWTYKNETGICILDESNNIVHLSADLYDDHNLIDIIRSAMVEPNERVIISVDLPLIVNNDTGHREADLEVIRDRIHGQKLRLLATNKQFMNKQFSCIRGENLMTLFKSTLNGKLLTRKSDLHSDVDAVIFETFPTGIYLGLFPDLYMNKYKLSSRLSLEVLKSNMTDLLLEINKSRFIKNLLDYFPQDLINNSFKKKNYKLLEDSLDALLCALISSLSISNTSSFKFYGSGNNGLIVLPKEKPQGF